MYNIRGFFIIYHKTCYAVIYKRWGSQSFIDCERGGAQKQYVDGITIIPLVEALFVLVDLLKKPAS